MKKLLAVLMAVLVAFSAFSFVVMADEVVAEEPVETVADDEAVVPQNFFQLTAAFFVKSFDKFASFFIGLFGEFSGMVDGAFASAVEDIAKGIDNLLAGA